jgi:DNA-binding beta-propeller fold protein YncE
MLKLLLAASLTALLAGTTAAAPMPAYRLVKTLSLGAPDRWDYVVAEPGAGRVYIAHGDRLAVLDARSASLIGNVEGIAGGTHGVALSPSNDIGITDDGRNGQAILFDPKSLRILKTIPADADADGIAADPLTGHAFVVEGDPGTITVVDMKRETVVATIKVGEKMEYAVAGEPGTIYVAGEEKGDLLKIDARTNAVARTWPMPGCASPHGLAFDPAAKRLFLGCINSMMMVVDATDGHIVVKLPIGRGSDAIAFDPGHKRVLSSNGLDGTVTIYRQESADRYAALTPLRTAVSGRTMAVDAATGRLFVAAADTQPAATPGGRPRIMPGTLRVLVFDPVE